MSKLTTEKDVLTVHSLDTTSKQINRKFALISQS